MKKVIHIEQTKEQEKDPYPMDLLVGHVRYDSGDSGKIYLYRVNFDAILEKQRLMEKYRIPEKEMDRFLCLANESYKADHFYDNED